MSTTVGEKYTIFKTFPAKLEKLHAMMQYVIDYSNTIGFSHNELLKIELALEEALVNTINYGYRGGHGFIEITCSTLSKGGIKVVLKDQGVAFNPITSSNHGSKEEPGGWGLFLMKNIMDDMSYRREHDSNILTFVKYKK